MIGWVMGASDVIQGSFKILVVSRTRGWPRVRKAETVLGGRGDFVLRVRRK